MLSNKKNLIGLIVIIGLAGWANSLSGKLKHEKSISEALRVELKETASRVITKTVIKRVPVMVAGKVALDGRGEAIFSEVSVTDLDNSTTSRTETSEASRTETELKEKSAYNRTALVAWNPVKQTEIGLVYSQRLLGPFTVGAMGQVDLLGFKPSGYVLAGISF